MSVVNAPTNGFLNFQLAVRDFIRKSFRLVPFLGFELEGGVSAEKALAFEKVYMLTGSRKMLIPSSSFLQLRDHPSFPNFLVMTKKKKRTAYFIFFNGDVIELRFDLV